MLLDTFTLLFEADSKQLKDGLADSKKQAEKLTEELGDADKKAGALSSSMGSALKALGTLAAGYFAIGAAKASFAETVEELNTIGRTAESLGESVQNVDAFGKALTLMGGDAQGARDSMMDMAESIGEAMQDVESGRAKTFSALKISLKDANGGAITATEGMLRLSDAVSGMSKDQAIFRIKELGITDNRTVEMILKGRKEMERMLSVQKEQSAVTKEAVENAKQYKESISRLNNAQDSIATQAAATLLPILIKVVDVIAQGSEWMRDNSQTVTAFFAAIAAVVAAIYLPAMIAAAAATLAATWPIIAAAAVVTALAAAFALLYDDIQNFVAGNDSFIGQMVEKYPIVAKVVGAVMDGVVASVKFAKDFIAGAMAFISSMLDKISAGVKSVAGFLGFGGGDVDVNMQKGNQAIEGANASPLNGTTSNAISNTANSVNKETNVHVGQVTVQTQATDAAGISSDIGNSLNEQLASLDTEFSSGVDR